MSVQAYTWTRSLPLYVEVTLGLYIIRCDNKTRLSFIDNFYRRQLMNYRNSQAAVNSNITDVLDACVPHTAASTNGRKSALTAQQLTALDTVHLTRE